MASAPPTCHPLTRSAHAHARLVHRCPSTHGHRAGCLIPKASAFSSPEFREHAKQLSRLFYGADAPTADKDAAIQADHAPNTGAQPPYGPQPTAGAHPSPSPSDAAAPQALAARLADLPLWRSEWVTLVGQQSVLHVHTPHYVHMFDRLLAAPRPWVFGHLYLPAGSKNLGRQDYALTGQGSKAPRVGVLMEVNRAVRLTDGRMMVLCTALCRIKVDLALQETPYSRAAVRLYHEAELLEDVHPQALQATLEASSAEQQPELDACGLMRAAAEVAAAAASAAGACWLEYEAATARASSWTDACPREAASEAEAQLLMAAIVDHGVLDVLPLPDGPVVGRWDLAALQARAEAAAAAALTAEAALALRRCSGGTAGGTTGSADEMCSTWQVYGSSDGCDLNVAAAVDGAEEAEQVYGLGPRRQRPVGASAVGLELTGDTTTDLTVAEARVWEELDLVASLNRQVNQRRLGLPLGLLQLRPSSPQRDLLGLAATAPAPDTSAGEEAGGTTDRSAAPSRVGEGSSSSRTAAPAAGGGDGAAGTVQFAASEGLEVSADPRYPSVRRWQRLSYAMASSFSEAADAQQRQVWLESPSVLARICAVLARVQDARRVLAAKAAVKALGRQKRKDA